MTGVIPNPRCSAWRAERARHGGSLLHEFPISRRMLGAELDCTGRIWPTHFECLVDPSDRDSYLRSLPVMTRRARMHERSHRGPARVGCRSPGPAPRCPPDAAAVPARSWPIGVPPALPATSAHRHRSSTRAPAVNQTGPRPPRPLTRGPMRPTSGLQGRCCPLKRRQPRGRDRQVTSRSVVEVEIAVRGQLG
jgi:hypothetical protein